VPRYWLLQAIFPVLVAAGPACAQDHPAVWLNPGLFTHHFRAGDYREDNYGLGVELRVAPAHSFIGGSFINSDRERSHYAGYYWRPWRTDAAGVELSAGLAFMAIDGYSNTNNGNWFPVLFPTLSAEYKRIGANLIYVPGSNNGSALSLQLKLRVW
jgi:hypothetical protein